MTFSQKFNKETKPLDYLLSAGYRATKFELENHPDPRKTMRHIEAALKDVVAEQIKNLNTVRVEEGNSTLYRISVFVIPEDDFFGLVTDMAKAMLQRMGAENKSCE